MRRFIADIINMSISVLDIEHQNLSTLISSYWMCRHCYYLSTSVDISRVGVPCKHCGTPSKGGLLYFKLGVHSLIDLMQEYYHLHPNNSNSPKAYSSNTNNHHLAIAIFYCSLGELLLENYLIWSMNKSNIPENVQEELLKDVSMDKRLRLFHLFSGHKFHDAIKEIDISSNTQYLKIITRYMDVRKKRNSLLHTGNIMAVNEEMPKQCLLDSPELVHLFVRLHNKYFALNKIEKS